ncbi:MAG: CBS domain-containing protein [Desulfobacteraceae bacterium]|jgi:CBS domain-containing protein|nr:CBS domain-containing protein [Desulfobacteraceae bacterium]
MRGKVIKDFRPYETPSLVTDKAGLVDIMREFIDNPALHHVCVIGEGGKLLGIINRKHLFKVVFFHHVSPDTMINKLLLFHDAQTSGDIMLSHILTAKEDDSIDDVIRLMIEYNIRELPIIGPKGKVLGFLNILIIMRAWLQELEVDK